MSVVRVLKKIFVDGIFKNIVKVGKFIARIDDIPVVGNIIEFIPIAGPVMKLAIEKCEMAEALFSSGQGRERKLWAINELEKDLKKLGKEEKYIDDIISAAFLLWKGYAAAMTEEEFKKLVENGATNS
jgi:hypothetical protein